MDTLQDSTVDTGFRTIFSEISGQDQATEEKGQAMLSTATKHLLAACLLALTSAVSAAQLNMTPPSYVQDPVFGLRLPVSSSNLETLSEQVRTICEQIADNPTWAGYQWVFGVTQEGPTTYYLVGGFFERRNATRGQQPYFQPEQGGIYEVNGQSCGGDPAREVFEVRDTDRIPQIVLQRLAVDFASRLSVAVGGKERLRDLLVRQRVNVRTLSPELREAFEPYLKQTGR